MQVSRFLETNHPGRYTIYNLCSEREYSPDEFTTGTVVRVPFDDMQTPCLAQIEYLCRHASDWLAEHPDNVAVVHCLAGKGRTGLMISSLLLYTGEFSDPAEALLHYSEKRTHDGRGVTIPSQQRYVHYFQQTMKLELPMSGRQALSIDSVQVEGLSLTSRLDVAIAIWQRPAGTSRCSPEVFLLAPRSSRMYRHFLMTGCFRRTVDYTDPADGQKLLLRYCRSDFTWDSDLGCAHFLCDGKAPAFDGDIKIQVFSGLLSKSNFHFYSWHNTAFLSPRDPVELLRHQLDKPKKHLSQHARLEVRVRRPRRVQNYSSPDISPESSVSDFRLTSEVSHTPTSQEATAKSTESADHRSVTFFVW